MTGQPATLGAPCASVVPFHRAGYGMVTFSSDWRYTQVCPDAATWLGQPAERLLGSVVWDVYPGCADHPIGVVMRAVMASRLPSRIRAPLHDSDLDVVADVTPCPQGGIVVLFRHLSRSVWKTG